MAPEFPTVSLSIRSHSPPLSCCHVILGILQVPHTHTEPVLGFCCSFMHVYVNIRLSLCCWETSSSANICSICSSAAVRAWSSCRCATTPNCHRAGGCVGHCIDANHRVSAADQFAFMHLNKQVMRHRHTFFTVSDPYFLPLLSFGLLLQAVNMLHHQVRYPRQSFRTVLWCKQTEGTDGGGRGVSFSHVSYRIKWDFLRNEACRTSPGSGKTRETGWIERTPCGGRSNWRRDGAERERARG